MAEIKWYKRDPDAALSGMMQLTLEERGAYNTVLDLIYSRADKLLDDDRMIAGFLSCDLRVWKRIKVKLIDLGKLKVEDGFVRNLRATSEILKALGRVASAADAGRASAAARAAKLAAASNENNQITGANVATPVQQPLQLSTATSTTTSRAKQSPLDWDILESRLREAAGWQSEPHPNLCVVGQIAALIDSGADLERDVLPIVKAKAPQVRKRTSWNFFVDPITEARDKRLAISAPQPQSAQAPIWETWTDRQYEAAITAVKRSGRWPETFGPIDRIPERLIDDELRRILGRRA